MLLFELGLYSTYTITELRKNYCLGGLDRLAKKISDADSHLTRIEDSLDDERHRTAQHETIKDIKSILKHARKVDKYEDKILERKGEGR